MSTGNISNKSAWRELGEKYLHFINREAMIDQPIPNHSDKVGGDFLFLCGSPEQLADPNFVPHAVYQFEGVMVTQADNPNDPDIVLTITDLQAYFDSFMVPSVNA